MTVELNLLGERLVLQGSCAFLALLRVNICLFFVLLDAWSSQWNFGGGLTYLLPEKNRNAGVRRENFEAIGFHGLMRNRCSIDTKKIQASQT